MKSVVRILGGALLTLLALAVWAQPPPAAQMRTLGLIGGTSWRSSIEYYRDINQRVNDEYHNNTNPPLVLFNLNQRRVHDLQLEGRWGEIADMLVDASVKLRAAGAEAVLFCANTPYKVYSEVSHRSGMPILHIADAMGAAIEGAHLKKVGLIGTKYTMEDGFIAEWLKARYGIEVIVPAAEDARNELHRIVQKELGMGIFKPASKRFVLEQIAQLRGRGAQGIVLACTEFPLIITQSDVPIPVFDSTRLHAQMAVDFVLRRYEPRAREK